MVHIQKVPCPTHPSHLEIFPIKSIMSLNLITQKFPFISLLFEFPRIDTLQKTIYYT